MGLLDRLFFAPRALSGRRDRGPPFDWRDTKGRGPAAQILIAVALPLIALCIQWPIRDLVSPSIWVLFYPAVFMVSRLAGFRAAVLSSFISIVIVVYFFMQPALSFGIAYPISAFFSTMFYETIVLSFCYISSRLDATITALRKRSRELEDALQAEQQARSAIRQLQDERLSAIGGLAVALSHEVSQPILAATTYLHTLRKKLDENDRSEDCAELADLTFGQIARANEIIKHLRDFRSGDEPDKTYARLNETILAACDSMKNYEFWSSIALELDLYDGNDTLLFDKVQIRQVIINLLRNAADAMNDSERKQIVVRSAVTADGQARVDVVDCGCGIAPDLLGAMFDPFRTSKKNGTGIGLAISKAIIDAHYGTLTGSNNPSGGATFTFTLPK